MAEHGNINFHLTFKPEIQYIASIISIADGITAYDIKDISNMTGIPNGKTSGKVEPHIQYSKYMGLIDYKKRDGKYIISLTPLGEVVLREDPGLQEDLSILLCHAMICREVNGADVWSECVINILPKYKNVIKKDLLIKELEVVFPGKVNSKNVAPFFSSYGDMFSTLNMLNENSDIISLIPSSFKKEFIYLYAFVLWKVWEEKYPHQEEISSSQLEMLNFGKIFGWNIEQEYKVLEQLSDRELLRLNRQLMPYTILKLIPIDNLLNKLYSELC